MNLGVRTRSVASLGAEPGTGLGSGAVRASIATCAEAPTVVPTGPSRTGHRGAWRLVALAFGGLVAAPAALAAQTDVQAIQQAVSGWWERAARKAPGDWGIVIADQRGRTIWGVEPDQPLIPASTVKLFTTGFARSVLGGAARRPTRFLASGHLDRTTGTWVGTWSLQLNGDVTLERARRDGPSLGDLAEQLAARGIRRLTGPLAVQSEDGPADAEWPTVWSPRYRGRLFAPLIGPITLNENVVRFAVRPTRVGRRAELVGAAPDGAGALVTVTARTRPGRRSRLSLQPRPNGGWVLGGWIGSRAGTRGVAAVATEPKAVLRAVWAAALRQAGIEWTEQGFPEPPDTAGPRVLAEVVSPPFDSVASEVNRRSLNIGAELLLQWAAGRGAGAPEALAAHVRKVAGEESAVHLVDGSGLSPEDRVSPATFISYLARFPQTAAGRNFTQLLPANGSGTLRRLRRGLPEAGVVRAKTGTLDEVSTVVGYLGRQDGVLLVSLMYNGRRPHAARLAQWQLFRLLGADGVPIPSDSFAQRDEQMGGDSTAGSP